MKNDFNEQAFFAERPIIEYDVAEDNKINTKMQELHEMGECTCEHWDIQMCAIHRNEDEDDEFGNYFIED